MAEKVKNSKKPKGTQTLCLKKEKNINSPLLLFFFSPGKMVPFYNRDYGHGSPFSRQGKHFPSFSF
jgi:hypothetical protein